MTTTTTAITRDGKCFRWEDCGVNGGTIYWYTARQDGQTQPSPRAIWCRTQREARTLAGAANVAANLR